MEEKEDFWQDARIHRREKRFFNDSEIREIDLKEQQLFYIKNNDLVDKNIILRWYYLCKVLTLIFIPISVCLMFRRTKGKSEKIRHQFFTLQWLSSRKIFSTLYNRSRIFIGRPKFSIFQFRILAIDFFFREKPNWD